jgi:hypothetical protein
MKVKHFILPTKVNNCVFYLNHKNSKAVNFCSPGNRRIDEINMIDITSVNFGKDNGNFIDRTDNKDVSKILKNRCLTMRLGKDFIDLIFESEKEMVMFCTAIVAFFEDTYTDEDNQE